MKLAFVRRMFSDFFVLANLSNKIPASLFCIHSFIH